MHLMHDEPLLPTYRMQRRIPCGLDLEDSGCAGTSSDVDLLLNVFWPRLLAVQHTQGSVRVPPTMR